MKNRSQITKNVKKLWPTKAAMEQVYAMKLWGDNQTDFYSGEGSHHPELVTPYVRKVTAFLKSFKNPLEVCDLGCGDFNVGRTLVKHTAKYVAVDIVSDLILHNRNTFESSHLEFRCLDIAVDELPSGDCAILRQVLQHLSNAEIHCIVDKLSSFKYVILTEHLPDGDYTPNVDIISGQGTRLKKGSGVNLLASPFHFKVKAAELLTAVRLDNGNGTITTTLYTVF